MILNENFVKGNVEEIIAETTTLDQIFLNIKKKEEKKDKINFLKIDVQRSELDLIKGGLKALKFFDFIIIEIGTFVHIGQDLKEIIDLLYERSFLCTGCVDAPATINGFNGTMDLLFVNKNSVFYNLTKEKLNSFI